MNCIQTTFVSRFSAGYCWPFTKTKWTKLSTTKQKIFIETAMLLPTAFISEFISSWSHIIWLHGRILFGFRLPVLGKWGLKGRKKYRQTKWSIKHSLAPLNHFQQEIILNYDSLTFQKRKLIYCFNSIVCQKRSTNHYSINTTDVFI